MFLDHRPSITKEIFFGLNQKRKEREKDQQQQQHHQQGSHQGEQRRQQQQQQPSGSRLAPPPLPPPLPPRPSLRIADIGGSDLEEKMGKGLDLMLEVLGLSKMCAGQKGGGSVNVCQFVCVCVCVWGRQKDNVCLSFCLCEKEKYI